MADSIRASKEGLKIVDQARRRKRWNKTAVLWCRESYVSRSTLSRFWASKPIRSELFIAICSAVGINWEDIKEDSTLQEQSLLSLPETLPKDSVNASFSQNIEPATDKSLSLIQIAQSVRYDWGEAPESRTFYGRSNELNLIQKWIIQENSRLVTILGMGGMGKTALAAKFARLHQHEFALAIWRSLRNAPTLETILTDLIQFLAQEQEVNLPKNLDGKILCLLKWLRECRCLLILDNFESILQSGDRVGQFRTGYEEYGQLLRCISESPHQSCLILTTREKPKSLTIYEGETLSAHALYLKGLPAATAREIFQDKGTFVGSDKDWQALITSYGGNPLALKIVASGIRDFWDGSLERFLEFSQPSVFLFDDICDLLNCQFERLTALEQVIMYWLAINRKPTSLQQLQSDFLAHVPTRELLESLCSLQRRSLIEKSAAGFTQQPVVMEYVTPGVTTKKGL